MKACRHFKGDRPCKYYWTMGCTDCENSSHYNPHKERILLIKLDALGDVVRSTALAEGIKRKYPDSQLTWVTQPEATFFIKNNSYVDRILKYNSETVSILQHEKFDIIINLDKDPKATSMIMSFTADEYRGYGLHEEGYPMPLNKGSIYHYDMCLDNWGAKTKNKLSYQELIYQIAEIEYKDEKPIINLDKEFNDTFRKMFYSKHSIKPEHKLILLNTGCGPVYPHKKWTFEGFDKLIEYLLQDRNNKIILAGSHSETETNLKLWESHRSFRVINTTNQYSIEQFCSLVDLCDLVVTGDTVALHIAISLNTKIVSFFGPTPHQEVNLFGLGKKLVRKELDCLNCYDQFPCPYDGKCMSLITPETVHKSIKELL